MITAGYLALHSQGRKGGRDVALLDVCQDYVLHALNQHDVFDLGVVLKGGTSLRKFRAGNAGRFSTDLDFATPDIETAKFVIDTLEELGEIFNVSVRLLDRETLRARLIFDTNLGTTAIPAKLEFSPRGLWLPTMTTPPVLLPVHRGYEFTPSAMPVPALEESIAEKLAAWYRRRKLRDLYDIFWYGKQRFNEPLVRRMFVLKVWCDIVHDGLGKGPINPATVISDSDIRKIPQEDIGLLTHPVQPDHWLASIRERFRFITEIDNEEHRVTACSPRDAYFIDTLIEQIKQTKLLERL